MNKKTVKEAIEQGLKYLEKVMIEVEFSNKNNDNSAFFYSKLNGGITISGDTEIYLQTDTAPEFERDREQFEPYDNQDAKIDFSVAGQWLQNALSGAIIRTNGIVQGVEFGFHYLGQKWAHYQCATISEEWQLLTPEQMKPILEELENLKLKA